MWPFDKKEKLVVASGSASDIDAFLATDPKFFVTPFDVYQSDLKQTYRQSPSAETFIDFLKNYRQIYTSTFIFKRNSGVNQFTYETGNEHFGMMVTVTKQAPGVETMNPVQEYFSHHKAQLWLFKHGLKVVGTAFVLLVVAFVAAHPGEVPAGTAVLYALKLANDWLNQYDPDAYMEGVGAKKEDKKQ